MENRGNLNQAEEAEELTPEGSSKGKTLESKVHPEQVEEANKVILESLGISEETRLDDFEGTLIEATKALPRYQEIEQSLEGVEAQDLPYELFKLLQSKADTEELDPDAPQDGVLIKSMQSGHLGCAGRTLIASTYLQSHNIEHTTIQAPGHTFLIIEQSGDTLVYFDANGNLYFTFPKQALEGYQDIKTMAECKIQEYAPRELDFWDGTSPVFDHFVVMPAQEGRGRVYLGNLAAALNGNEEFTTSGIAENKDLIPAVNKIKTNIYGENKVLDSFLSEDRMEIKDAQGNLIGGLLKEEEQKKENDKALRSKFFNEHPDNPTEEQFINYFIYNLDNYLGKRMPFIKNTKDEQKVAFAQKLWESVKERYSSNSQS
jgi:hypothetical protein